MTADESGRLELQIARLQGSVDTGFATLRGELMLVATGQVETRSDLAKLETRTDSLESRRFPLPVIGGLMGAAGICLSAFTLVRGG